MLCKYCKSENTCKAGYLVGKQRYKCKSCGKYFTDTPPRGRSREDKLKALQLYSEGMSYRGIGRFLKVSHVSVQKWIDVLSKELCKNVNEIGTKHPVVEVDEMWHYVKKKET